MDTQRGWQSYVKQLPRDTLAQVIHQEEVEDAQRLFNETWPQYCARVSDGVRRDPAQNKTKYVNETWAEYEARIPSRDAYLASVASKMSHAADQAVAAEVSREEKARSVMAGIASRQRKPLSQLASLMQHVDPEAEKEAAEREASAAASAAVDAMQRLVKTEARNRGTIEQSAASAWKSVMHAFEEDINALEQEIERVAAAAAAAAVVGGGAAGGGGDVKQAELVRAELENERSRRRAVEAERARQDRVTKARAARVVELARKEEAARRRRIAQLLSSKIADPSSTEVAVRAARQDQRVRTALWARLDRQMEELRQMVGEVEAAVGSCDSEASLRTLYAEVVRRVGQSLHGFCCYLVEPATAADVEGRDGGDAGAGASEGGGDGVERPAYLRYTVVSENTSAGLLSTTVASEGSALGDFFVPAGPNLPPTRTLAVPSVLAAVTEGRLAIHGGAGNASGGGSSSHNGAFVAIPIVPAHSTVATAVLCVDSLTSNPAQSLLPDEAPLAEPWEVPNAPPMRRAPEKADWRGGVVRQLLVSEEIYLQRVVAAMASAKLNVDLAALCAPLFDAKSLPEVCAAATAAAASGLHRSCGGAVAAYYAVFDAGGSSLRVVNHVKPSPSKLVPDGASAPLFPCSSLVGTALSAGSTPRPVSFELRSGFVAEPYVLRADCSTANDVGVFTKRLTAKAPPKLRQSLVVVPVTDTAGNVVGTIGAEAAPHKLGPASAAVLVEIARKASIAISRAHLRMLISEASAQACEAMASILAPPYVSVAMQASPPSRLGGSGYEAGGAVGGPSFVLTQAFSINGAHAEEDAFALPPCVVVASGCSAITDRGGAVPAADGAVGAAVGAEGGNQGALSHTLVGLEVPAGSGLCAAVLSSAEPTLCESVVAAVGVAKGDGEAAAADGGAVRGEDAVAAEAAGAPMAADAVGGEGDGFGVPFLQPASLALLASDTARLDGPAFASPVQLREDAAVALKEREGLQGTALVLVCDHSGVPGEGAGGAGGDGTAVTTSGDQLAAAGSVAGGSAVGSSGVGRALHAPCPRYRKRRTLLSEDLVVTQLVTDALADAVRVALLQPPPPPSAPHIIGAIPEAAARLAFPVALYARACERVESLPRDHLFELLSAKSPHTAVVSVVAAILRLLGAKESQTRDWNQCRALSKSRLVERILDFDPSAVVPSDDASAAAALAAGVGAPTKDAHGRKRSLAAASPFFEYRKQCAARAAAALALAPADVVFVKGFGAATVFYTWAHTAILLMRYSDALYQASSAPPSGAWVSFAAPAALAADTDA